MKSYKTDNYIYIITNKYEEHNNRVKIGSTKDYEKRYYNYKTGCSIKWRYIKVYNIKDFKTKSCNDVNCYKIDNEIQTKFSNFLTNKLYEECEEGGVEWYNDDDNLISKIESFLSNSYIIEEVNESLLNPNNFNNINSKKGILNFIKEEEDLKLLEMNRSLRPYQCEYVKDSCEELIHKKRDRISLIAPTGAGKTRIF